MMFRKHFPFILYLALLSAIAGFLFSKMSWIGRFAMHFRAYQQYSFFKTWWKGALLVFLILMMLFIVQHLMNRWLKPVQAFFAQLIMLAVASAGLYFTYADFQHYYAHRWLHEKFHLGGYLFWIGWISISLYLMINRSAKKRA